MKNSIKVDSIDVNILYSVGGVSTAILIKGKEGDLLVDAGDGVLRELVERNYSFGRLKAVLLTHECFDHLAGLMALIMFLGLLKREEKLKILVPKPAVVTRKIIDIAESWSHPVGDRVRLPSQIPIIKIVEVIGDELFFMANLRVKPISVDHNVPAVGYSIQNENGFKVVISGDTAPCKRLIDELRAANIAVLECTFRDEFKEVAAEHKHMTESDCKRLSLLAKRTVHIHKLPPMLLHAFFDLNHHIEQSG